MSKPHPIIQTVLDAHFPGMAKPVMDEDDRWAFAIAELRAEVRNLRAENLALRERADVRAIVGELRVIEMLLADGRLSAGIDQTRKLLRRLDESQ